MIERSIGKIRAGREKMVGLEEGDDASQVGTQSKRVWPVLLIAVLCVTALWAGCWFLLRGDPERGTFGDMFGAINALFSGLAFAALVYTVWMQREELSLQRQELALTRGEMAGQRLEMAAQNATITRQRFENTFFELLRVHQENVASIDLRPGSGSKGVKIAEGRDCFKIFHRNLLDAWKKERPPLYDSPSLEPDEHTVVIGRVYGTFYSEHQGDLGHYFRHLYHMVKFVATSDEPDKKRYTNFIRAQLSNYELAVLFYNGLYVHAVEKFKPLMEEFALLKALPTGMLLHPHHSDFYDQRAFAPSIPAHDAPDADDQGK